MNTITTTQARWNAALKAVRKEGYTAKQNISSCCTSCVPAAKRPQVWHTSAQGARVAWTPSGNPTKALRAYFNFGDINAAQALVEAMEAQGFTIEWNGTINESVCVTL